MGWCGSRLRDGDGGKDEDDGRLTWTARIDGFSAVEVCQPVGTAESGRFGQLASGGVELAAPTAPLLLLLLLLLRGVPAGDERARWLEFARQTRNSNARVRGARGTCRSKKKAAKVNRGFQECAAPRAAWMEDDQAPMGDARDVVANGEVTTCRQRSIFWPSPSTATPSHQNRK